MRWGFGEKAGLFNWRVSGCHILFKFGDIFCQALAFGGDVDGASGR